MTAILFLVARPDGRSPKLIRAESPQGAVLSRVKDVEDDVDGILAVWRLGNFPTQYEIVEWPCNCFIPTLEGAGQHAPGCDVFKTEQLREIGNPSVVPVP